MDEKKVAFDNQNERKWIAIATSLIILFIPTLSFVITSTRYGEMVETTYYWPWLILIHLQPSAEYFSDQWVVSGLPWNLIVFFPFYYALRLCYNIYHSEENLIKNSGMIALSALGQLGLIFMMSASQSNTTSVSEVRKLTFIPVIMVLLLHAYYTISKNFQVLNGKFHSKVK